MDVTTATPSRTVAREHAMWRGAIRYSSRFRETDSFILTARRPYSQDFILCTPASSGSNSVGDFGDLDHFGDVVDADDVRATQNARRDCGGGPPDALFCCDAAERVTNECLSRRAHEQRTAKAREFRQARKQFEVLRVVLAEANSGVEDDLRFCDSGALRAC